VVLLDTSVWIDHLRRGDDRAAALLERGDVVCHPLVIGELACGSLIRRAEILGLLGALPQATQATHAEIVGFIDGHCLHGQGLGLIEMHLLWAAASQTHVLWTRDRRLRQMAQRLRVAPNWS
jgi:predicted nucleic acid-binding protein